MAFIDDVERILPTVLNQCRILTNGTLVLSSTSSAFDATDTWGVMVTLRWAATVNGANVGGVVSQQVSRADLSDGHYGQLVENLIRSCFDTCRTLLRFSQA